MSAVTYFGVTLDPDELREIADLADQAEPGDDALAARLAALPRETLTRQTLAGGPEVIAERLRAVAEFMERRQQGVPFGGYEFAEAMARLRDTA